MSKAFFVCCSYVVVHRLEMMISKLPTQSSVMTVMAKAVVKASKGLLRDFSELENLQVSIKQNKSFVTSADLKANKILKDALLYARPTYSLISEESEEIIGEDPSHKWIIDPLDGTLNYMHGVPHWAISVALEKDDEIIAAITYDPVKDEMFWAEKGCGAYLNDKKIRVSGRRLASDVLLTVASIKHVSGNVVNSVSGVRKTGCVTLDMAYIAAGRSDLLFLTDKNPNKWDVAAGMLLIKEAGGIVATENGKTTSNFSDVSIICNINLMPDAAQIYKTLQK
ncbi:MAG: inositol monophosphatase [Alphaproteobacteria bacterium]|nr:inositol monophosphatase [Alphaproteobacteria bacterium]